MIIKVNGIRVFVEIKADAIIPLERTREMASLLPNGRFVNLAGVGHMPIMENPAETAAALKPLIKAGSSPS